MNIFKKHKNDFIMLGIIVLLIAVDLVTKIVTDGVKNFKLIPWFLTINSVHNTGAAFGMLGETNWGIIFFSVFSIIAVCGMVFFHLANKQKNLLYYFAFALIISGAVGNLIDRLNFLYVRDFLEFGFFPWATGNIADLFLIAGTVCACVYFIFNYKFPETHKKDTENKDAIVEEKKEA